jgi:23S rRNA (pseudouridine1915-N3)-methyltransferase
MCIKAKAPDSVGLSELMQKWSLDGRRNVFLIGGSNGLSDEVLARADERVSFSNLTFPHGLMRVILLEQLYRAERIRTGEPYHK